MERPAQPDNLHAYTTVGGYWIAHAARRIGRHVARGTGRGDTRQQAEANAAYAMDEEIQALRCGWQPSDSR